MTTSMLNNTLSGEQAQVLHISILFECSQHPRATYLKSSKSYANTQKEKNRTT